MIRRTLEAAAVAAMVSLGAALYLLHGRHKKPPTSAHPHCAGCDGCTPLDPCCNCYDGGL